MVSPLSGPSTWVPHDIAPLKMKFLLLQQLRLSCFPVLLPGTFAGDLVVPLVETILSSSVVMSEDKVVL